MIHYDNSGKLASFETKEAMLEAFPEGLEEVADLDSFLNPPKTYAGELAELNADKKAKEKDFAEKFALILGRNGPTQDPATSAIRSNLLEKIDSDYLAEKAALNLKYYGE